MSLELIKDSLLICLLRHSPSTSGTIFDGIRSTMLSKFCFNSRRSVVWFSLWSNKYCLKLLLDTNPSVWFKWVRSCPTCFRIKDGIWLTFDSVSSFISRASRKKWADYAVITCVLPERRLKMLSAIINQLYGLFGYSTGWAWWSIPRGRFFASII